MFGFKRIATFATAAILLAPITAQAKEDLCRKVLPREIAVGEYSIKRDPSVIHSVQDVPFPGTLDSASITMSDSGKLVMKVQGPQGIPIVFERQQVGQADLWGVIEDHLTEEEMGQVDISLCPLNASRLPNLLANGYGEKKFAHGMSALSVNLYVSEVVNGRIHANGDLHLLVKVNGNVMADYKTAILLTPR